MVLIKQASKSTIGESGMSIMSGSIGSNFAPVAVDADGNMKAVLSAVSTVTIAGGISGTQDIRGADGTTARSIAVDSSGRLISIMTGSQDSNIRYIQVDSSGRMISLMSGSFEASINPVALDSAGRMLNVVLTSGSNHQQYSNFNVTTTPSTVTWDSKAYSVIINNQGPQVIHVAFDNTASTATYPVASKYAGGGDIQHSYLSIVAATGASTVYAIATW